MSSEGQELVQEALSPLGSAPAVDLHVHLIGQEVNPHWLSAWHPLKRARTMIYLSAAGIRPGPQVEADYVERLVQLHRGIAHPARCWIFAMDRHYRPNGEVDLGRTSYYVPNDYVYAVARRYPELFVPVVSIHPYRKDAVAELIFWAEQGCRHVKWLPNAMGIDPSSDQIEPFYRVMRERHMILLSHTGSEQALDARGTQHLGNPLLLKKPLDLGVRVVALHCASRGTFRDLDSPKREKMAGFDLLLRMLESPDYEGLLFGEISGVTFYNRLDRPLRTLLARKDLHHRLVNGSDYPLPGIRFVLRTSSLARAGFITATEAKLLDEVYAFNPLLFDLVVKRTLRHPETGAQFPVSVFACPAELEPWPPMPSTVVPPASPARRASGN